MRTKTWQAWVFGWNLVFAGLATVYARDPVTLELTRNGQPSATIMVADKPTRAAQLAAAELQVHILKISGASLPVVSDTNQVKGLRILVGESKVTQAIGLRGQDFKPQEYLIRFQPDLLVLMGRDKEDYEKLDYGNPDGRTLPGIFDEQATCYAVYDFLERYCEVRWYLPTDLGTVYPQSKTLRISGGELRRMPHMESRQVIEFIRSACVTGWCRYTEDLIGTAFGGTDRALPWREQVLYNLRLRNGGREVTLGGHSFYGYYPRFWSDSRYPQYFERRRPELFAQGYTENPPPQMCYTSPELLQQTVKDARDFFNGKEQRPLINELSSGRDYFVVGAMDNSSFCLCPRCNAMIRKNVPPGSSRFDSEQSISDYFFVFVNQVAREVKKTHPDKYLSTMAYNAYINLPHEPLEPNVAITIVLGGTSRYLWSTSETETFRKAFDNWVRESPQRPKYVWLHWCFPVWSATLANPRWKPFPGFAGHKIVEEMKRYNEAGIRGMFVQNSSSPPCLQELPLWDQLELYLVSHLADDPEKDGNKLIDEFFERYYGGAAKPMKGFYELVEEVYCNPNNYPDGVGSQTPYVAWECLGTEPRMQKLERMMGEAHAACRTDLERQRVALFDKGIWQVMCAGKEQYELVRKKANATMQSAKAPCLPTPPGNDPRKLDWEQAGRLTNWATFDGKPTERKVEGRIAHDGATLYLHLEERLDTSKIVRNAPDVWSGDDWEIFVARRSALGEAYRQIGIDAKGQFVDLSLNLVDQGIARDCGAVIYSETNAPDCWTVSVAIPLNKLLAGKDQAKPGESICLNVIRSTRGSAETAAMWISTMTANFHSLDRLGKVALLPSGAQHENLIKNPGFEEVAPLSEKTHEWLQPALGVGCVLGKTWPDNWVPQVWEAGQCAGEKAVVVEGSPGREVHSGIHALLVNGGKTGIHLYQSDTGKGPKGRYHCKFYARGSGKLGLGTYEYSTKPGACPANHGRIGIFEMGPEWQQFEGIYEPSPKSDASFSLVLGVPSNTEATVDDFEFWEEEVPNTGN